LGASGASFGDGDVNIDEDDNEDNDYDNDADDDNHDDEALGEADAPLENENSHRVRLLAGVVRTN
jgi:hypothetical protein